jgi:hypothetical protein
MMPVLKIRRGPAPLLLPLLPLLLPLLPLLLALPAAPLHAANKTANVTNTRALSFGRFAANTGGTIILGTAGARSKTGGVILMSGGTITSASFNLGEAGAGKSLNFTTITLPTTVSMVSNANTMTLSNFVSDPANTVLGTGKTSVLVGATLTVAPNQAAGNYSGSFVVTVNYQ